MGFEPGVDRIEVSDMTEAGFRATATLVREHLDMRAVTSTSPGRCSVRSACSRS